MKYSIRLLNSAYHIENVDGTDRAIVYLYGTTQEGQGIAVRTPHLQPYFQAVEAGNEIKKKLKKDDNVESIEDEELWVDGKIKSCTRIFTKTPDKLYKLKEWLKNNDLKLLASDIPFHYRYLYDKDLGGCVSFEGEEITDHNFTCKLVEATSIEKCEDFESDFKILSFDIENSIFERTIYCLSFCVKDSRGYIHEETLHGDENDILNNFVSAVSKYDPDIITGYNIDGYDLPLLVERAEFHGIDLNFGRNNSLIEQKMQRFWRVEGRVVVDAWWNVKREIRPRQESLNAVAKELLGREKHDVNPKKMDEEWQTRPEKVMDYCLEDAKLALEILEHIMVIQKYQHIGTVSMLPLDDVINGITSMMIDSLMIRFADSKKIGVPGTNRRLSLIHI